MSTQVTVPSSPRRVSADGSTLLLEGLRAADSGAYTCLARNSLGEETRLHTLNVLGEQGWDLRGSAGAIPGPDSRGNLAVPSPSPSRHREKRQ